ncbi:MAG: HDOD domain-containing protein [Myxococcota bacterium]
MATHPATTVAKLQKHLDELPTLPTVLMDLMRSDPNADGYFDRVQRLVSGDPAFATRLLRYANSPASAPMKPIVRVKDALSRLGCAQAVNLVIAASATRVFVPHTPWEKDLWVHAVNVANIAQHLAPCFGPPRIDPEEAYTCGLLHDLGRFVLYLEAPAELRAIDETDWETPLALIEAERRLCGFTHAELGAMAAAKWDLPVTIATVIRLHHSPPDSGVTPEQRALIELVRTADWLDISLRKAGDWHQLDDDAIHTRGLFYRGMRTESWTDRAAHLTREGLVNAEHTIAALGL